MLDTVQTVSQGSTAQPTVWHSPMAKGLQLRLVQTAKELRAVQKLRYDVFTQEMNAVFPDSADGIDEDHYDQWCHHFMVIDEKNDRVVGTYRLLTPEQAKLAQGYYTESEFDLSPLDAVRDSIVEVGRSCIHPDYRNGSAIMLLWTAIATLMQQHNYRYLLGCASVSLRDDGATAAKVWREIKDQIGQHPHLPVLTPLHRYPIEKLNSTLPARVPPLIKGYLNLGASICGEPAWDPDFNTADFPVLLDMNDMEPRYRRHFGLE